MMFPQSRHSGSSHLPQQLKFTTSDSCDRIKDEFQLLQAQYHSLKLECDKLASEKSEMQRHYVMYYEMSYGLNIEMHKQAEIVKRLNGICAQVLPYLSQEVRARASGRGCRGPSPCPAPVRCNHLGGRAGRPRAHASPLWTSLALDTRAGLCRRIPGPETLQGCRGVGAGPHPALELPAGVSHVIGRNVGWAKTAPGMFSSHLSSSFHPLENILQALRAAQDRGLEGVFRGWGSTGRSPMDTAR
ncbi:amino-terminal enhancer of split isoform X3 [Theropithecus gelada]|uniref:amino-terminal enhancer of split isoform X3 n=1 Tax=Theropithecus gelada TaxID=9565 RepID=UPI000DC1BD0E|nr:amino-terminal enhancer of split isoform X3 [Theropithecus gelada]